MSCTTILVGKKASLDGSTMIARTDDGFFDVKKLVTVLPEKQPRHYKSVIGHLEIELPDDPMRYTACPSVDKSHGIWAAQGINEANVAMTATETVTTNPRVLGADPMVRYEKKKARGGEEKAGGIGEEDMVVLVLPYIRSAREGVLRLGSLLEKYGTYESNGIAFSDPDEVWWMETIGGHHWIARKVPDGECVIMPNQFGLDRFDMNDAMKKGRDNLCSKDLKAFVEEYRLGDIGDGAFDPRAVFGSRTDSDAVYNTPRAWFMGRYIAPSAYKWDGEGADYTPESIDIPWSLVPERKFTPEDVKYLLSSHYQGTPYDPYGGTTAPHKGHYRPIGINRTGTMSICQLRGYMPKELAGVQWICFGATTFDAILPVYTDVRDMPKYLKNVEMEVSTDNFYWNSRLIDALADPYFGQSIQDVERYQFAVFSEARRILNEYDRRMTESGDFSLREEANAKLCDMAREKTSEALGKLLLTASKGMRNGFSRADN